MKKIILLGLLLFVFSNIVSAQTHQWRIQTTRRPLTSINFISPTKALIFGSDIIYKSSDGGVSWSFPIVQNPEINATFSNLCFVDSMYGWTCMSNTTIRKTSTGGDWWLTLPVGINFYRLNGLYFINRNTGWIFGQHVNYNNLVAKTSNGGVNWDLICSNMRFEPIQIYMLNENKGFAIPHSMSYDSVASTTDGGTSWNYIKCGNNSGTVRIFFLDSLNGWVLGFNAGISRTTNGGMNWTPYSNNIWNTYNMFFLNNMTGWITAIRKEIWKSTNGGVNWTKQLGVSSNEDIYRSIYFKNQYTGWASSGLGTVLKSTNGGNNWFSLIEPPHSQIVDIYFSNKYTGWAISNLSMGGYISRTVNGGNNWFDHLGFGMQLNAVNFINYNTGFVAATAGKILSTVNGGQNWNSLSIGNYSYNSIDFENSSTGWICGGNGQILKTTNSGLNWINQISGTNCNLYAVQFLDLNTGYIVCDSGKILKTTNSGTNWITSQPLENYLYKDLFFLNSSTGWAIGNNFMVNYGSERVIIKTTNGGSNWSTQHYSFRQYQGLSFMSIWFINSQTGWVATVYDRILKTVNGGINWFQDVCPVTVLEDYNTLFFIDSETGWIAGGYNTIGCGGTVLTTGSFPIGIEKLGIGSPLVFSLSQNYPNPFNPVTKIKFEVPLNKGGERGLSVRLIIYDILGREIQTLVDESKKPGTYEVDWDGSRYSSGVYFYRLVTDEFSQTKRMVLIK